MASISTLTLPMALLVASLLLTALRADGNQDQSAQSAGAALEANPNRPTDSNSADVLDPGILQWEYGFSREWDGGGAFQNLVVGEWRFGLLRNVEVRWGGNPWIRNSAVGGEHQGFGDQYFSAQYRLHEEKNSAPALAASYSVTVPVANQSQGLGSGRFDHCFAFLASKEIHSFTFDFNVLYNLIGREDSGVRDHNGQFFLAAQRSIYGPFSMMAELGGQTRLNSREDASASNLWAMAFRARPRVVLDGGIEVGITKGAPPKRIFFGITYAVADLHSKH